MNPKPTAREEYLEARVEALVRALEELRELLVAALDIIETPYYHLGQKESDQIKQIEAAVEAYR